MTNRKELTGLDWFGIISGCIGLIADAIALSSIFISTSETKSLSAGIWIISFFSIIYTAVILGFYARRFFCVRFNRRGKNLSKEDCRKIETGAFAIILVFAIPMFLSFGINAFLSIAKNMTQYKISEMDAILSGIFTGGVFGFMLCVMLNVAVRRIYSAFDPDFVLDEQEFF